MQRLLALTVALGTLLLVAGPAGASAPAPDKSTAKLRSNSWRT